MDLSLPVASRIEIDEVCKRTKSTLQAMLNLLCPPDVTVESSNVNGGSLGAVGDTLRFQVDGTGDVSLMVIDLPFDESMPHLKQPTAVITAGSRTSLSHVSAIAVAIALGQILSSDITDDALLLSSEPEINQRMLLDKIRLRNEQSDPLSASEELLHALDLI